MGAEIVHRRAYRFTVGADVKLCDDSESKHPWFVELNGYYSGIGGYVSMDPELSNLGMSRLREENLVNATIQASVADIKRIITPDRIGREAFIDALRHVDTVQIGEDEGAVPLTHFGMVSDSSEGVEDLVGIPIGDGVVDRLEIDSPEGEVYATEDVFRLAFLRLMAEGSIDSDEFFQANVIEPGSEKLEGLLANKLQQKELVPNQNRIPFFIWNGDMTMLGRVWDLWREDPALGKWIEHFPYVVVKGLYGAHGDQVRIFPKNDRTGIQSFIEQFPIDQAIVEPFIPSQNIDGHRDGCMRYLVDVLLWYEMGEVKYQIVNRFAYWRIPPGSHAGIENYGNQYDLNWRMRANKTSQYGITPHPVSDEDLEIAGDAVDQVVHNIADRFSQLEQTTWLDHHFMVDRARHVMDTANPDEIEIVDLEKWVA